MTVRPIVVDAAGALPALAEAIRAAKRDEPLAPVTVIVPTNAIGVTARRWLGANGGIAAIDLVTPQRLAERLAGAALAAEGRRPVSTPLIDLTVRAVLDDDAGVFAPVADHPSTVTSLRDLHRELRLGGARARERLAGSSSRGAAVARVSARVADRLADDWFDEADLLELATRRILAGAELFDRAVVFVPTPTSGLVCELLRAVGERIDVELVAEHTGVEALDTEMAGFVHALGADPASPAGRPGSRPSPDVSIVSTTDADEEVREAVRLLVDGARDGIAFARMALVWPTDQPYARLVEHHLDAAGVPWNGRPGTLVTERLVPRFLLDLLDLDRRGLRRTELFDFLADVPVQGPSGRVSVARWERLARSAGVTRDDHWTPRLAARATSLRTRPEPRERDADACDELAAFVDGLRRDLGAPRRRRTWLEWVEWCERQVERRLGRSVLDQLDEAERLASDHTNRVLDRLRHLDAISGPVDRVGFRDAFAAEFEGAPGRLGRLGDGVTIGSIGGTPGLDADLTIVLGAADGLLPPPPHPDPLVSESDRRAAGLADADARVHRVHRSLLGHLATSRRVVISVPRGDLRSTSERLPSRWIEAHAASAPRRDVTSHHGGLITTAFPSHRAEHRLRGRAVAVAAHDGLAAECRHDTTAQRALAMRAARRSGEITVYDGDLTSVAVDHFTQPVSPSRLESWMACPHGYFMRYLLHVRPIDEPDDELGLSPLERGNAVHETLDRFQRRVIDGELPQPGPNGWSDEHVAALLEVYEGVADEFERTGRTGRAALWHLDRAAVRDELLTWFEHDGALMAGRGAEVFRSELRFGDDATVTLPMPGGRELAVAGFVDRVDRRRSGGLVVTDHKTGSPRNFTNVDAADPTEGATKFQLPVYASAALALVGERPGGTDVDVLAEYGFFGRGKYERHGYTLDAAVWSQVADDVGHVVAGIESGLYPSVTGPPGFDVFVDCHYCQPDRLGVHERFAEWSAKRDDPRIVTWFPPEDDDAG